MKLRPCVRRFAEAMEAALREHDGDRGHHGWREATEFTLLGRLDIEMEEFREAIHKHRRAVPWDEDDAEVGSRGLRKAKKAVAKEAADVGNFAMMIADVLQALPEEPTEAEKKAEKLSMGREGWPPTLRITVEGARQSGKTRTVRSVLIPALTAAGVAVTLDDIDVERFEPNGNGKGGKKERIKGVPEAVIIRCDNEEG